MKLKVQITEKGPGFGAILADIAGARITIGVQGDEAAATHPNSEWSVGELASRHEMGLGVVERSFLRAWFDRNQERVNRETAEAMRDIMAKKISRKKAMERLGYNWVKEIRQDIESGKVKPAISASTARRKGHSIPLLETATMANAVTFKLFLQQIKSIQDPAMRQVLRDGPSE